jgi:hypothetical protein
MEQLVVHIEEGVLHLTDHLDRALHFREPVRRQRARRPAPDQGLLPSAHAALTGRAGGSEHRGALHPMPRAGDRRSRPARRAPSPTWRTPSTSDPRSRSGTKGPTAAG